MSAVMTNVFLVDGIYFFIEKRVPPLLSLQLPSFTLQPPSVTLQPLPVAVQLLNDELATGRPGFFNEKTS